MVRPEFIRLALGLAFLLAANICLGSMEAFLAGTYDPARLKAGAIKAAAVFTALLAVYAAGLLNPDLLVVEAGGNQVTLLTAVHLLLTAAFTAYAVDILRKLYRVILRPAGSSSGPEPEADSEQELEALTDYEQQQPGDLQQNGPQ